MKNFPFFTTESGVAALTLREIPYQGKAYIKILERKLSEIENEPDEKSKIEHFDKEFSTLVIQEYLKKIMKEKPKNRAIGGVLLSTPPLKPTTVAEASALAKNYIKRKGE